MRLMLLLMLACGTPPAPSGLAVDAGEADAADPVDASDPIDASDALDADPIDADLIDASPIDAAVPNDTVDPFPIDRADVLLQPIHGAGDWNHLSVRAACAIALDRLVVARA